MFHRAPQAPIRQLPETPQQPSSDVFRFVLEQLYQASEARQPIGRERLLQLARDAFVPTSQQEIRSILARWQTRDWSGSAGGGAAAADAGGPAAIRNWSNLVFRSTNKTI